jgi:hypothetical protein
VFGCWDTVADALLCCVVLLCLQTTSSMPHTWGPLGSRTDAETVCCWFWMLLTRALFALLGSCPWVVGLCSLRRGRAVMCCVDRLVSAGECLAERSAGLIIAYMRKETLDLVF